MVQDQSKLFCKDCQEITEHERRRRLVVCTVCQRIHPTTYAPEEEEERG